MDYACVAHYTIKSDNFPKQNIFIIKDAAFLLRGNKLILIYYIDEFYYNRDNKPKRLLWFGHVERMEGNIILKRVLYMN
jgi:hypothetical protein